MTKFLNVFCLTALSITMLLCLLAGIVIIYIALSSNVVPLAALLAGAPPLGASLALMSVIAVCTSIRLPKEEK